MITKNKFVTVSYELRTAADAEPIEIADEKTPLGVYLWSRANAGIFRNEPVEFEHGKFFRFSYSVS